MGKRTKEYYYEVGEVVNENIGNIRKNKSA